MLYKAIIWFAENDQILTSITADTEDEAFDELAKLYPNCTAIDLEYW